jgi:hypothetical protein
MGAGVDATYKNCPMSECAHLLKDSNNKLAFSAANSMSFVSSCMSNAWFCENYALHNIANSACTFGLDELCSLDENPALPTCPNGLGSTTPLKLADPVMDVVYGTGVLREVLQ